MAEQTLENPQDTSAASPAPPEAVGPACEKCGQPHKATACPRCGWYPVLGIHVEIDEAFEAAMKPAESTAAGEDPLQAPKKAAWTKHLEVWAGLIPWWGWLLLGTTLACVAAAIAVRLATATQPTLHTWCGVGGLIGGILVTLVAHVVAFVLASAEDANYGVFDILTKPVQIWKQLLGELPERLWLANTGNLGLSLAVSSAAIVGGIPYERLLDWGFKAPPKASLVGAIADAAKKAPSEEMSMEEAVNEFAGDAGVDDLKGAGPAPKPTEAPREKLDCLIIGYQGDKAGRIDALLLASETGGKLKYVGRVVPELDAKEQEELRKKFTQHISTRPFVKTSDSGNWLRPKFTCSITYTKWPEGGRPQKIEWESMQGEVALPW